MAEYEYRLVDAYGWEWPDRGYSPEDLLEDKAYMEQKHPGKEWKIQERTVSEWKDVN